MQDNAFEHFLDEGLITKVIRPIKSGKEASVHLCRANPSTTGETLAALKVFHPPDRRAFRDEGLYRDGEFIKERRIRVAVEKRTTFGKEVAAAIWVDREWEMLGDVVRGRGRRAETAHAIRPRAPHDLHRGRGRRRAAAAQLPPGSR